MVTTTTLGDGVMSSIRSIDSLAPMTGISTSRSTTSGSSLSARSTASLPFSASPTTSIRSSVESISLTPWRNMLFDGGALDQVGRGPEPDQLAHQPRVVVHGHDDDPGGRRDVEHTLHRLPRPHDRHLDVQEHHIGLQPIGEEYGFPAVLCLADDLYPFVGGEHLPHALAEHGVVVGQQHPYPHI